MAFSNLDFTNLILVFSDIARELEEANDDVEELKLLFTSTKDDADKIKIGKSLIDMMCCEGNFMTVFAFNVPMISTNLSALLKFFGEMRDVIGEMEESLVRTKGSVQYVDNVVCLANAKCKFYDTKNWLYRYYDLTELEGI